ncbi:translocation/assembly module TamB domain-containing protein [candidate division KSB1 bacterium]|nr:translocation/assembly module TamB domain-containing protein [candidate division KSB1 bacterium]
MRARRWVIIVVLLALSFSGLVIHAGRFIRPNEKLKRFFLAQIRPMLGQDCDIQRVRLSLTSIHFLNVYLPQYDQRYSIFIKDLHVGYNFFRFILNGFDPTAISDHVLIQNPQIVFHEPAPETPGAKSLFSLSDSLAGSNNHSYEEQVQKFKFLRRLSVTNGEIYLQEDDSLRTLLANSIEGWVFSRDADTLNFRLNGNLFSSTQNNLRLDGKAELAHGNILAVNFLLNDFPLDEPIPQFEFSDLTMLGGRMHAALLFRQNPNPGSARRFDISGRIRVENASARLFSNTLMIDNLFATGRVRDWRISIEDIQCLLNGNPLSASASISDVFAPQIDLTADLARFRMKDFIGLMHLHPLPQIQGRADARLRIQGALNNLKLTTTLSAPQFRIGNTDFSGLSVRSTWMGRRLHVSALQIDAWNSRLAGEAEIDFRFPGKPVRASLSIEGDLGSQLRARTPVQIHSLVTQIDAEINGSLNNPIVFAQSKLIWIDSQSDSLIWLSELEFRDQQLSIRRLLNNHSPGIDGTVDFRHRPVRFDLIGHELQTLSPLLGQLPQQDFLRRRLRATARLSGDVRRFNLSGDLQRLQGSFYTIPLSSTSIDFTTGLGLRATGDLVLHPQAHQPMRAKLVLSASDSDFSAKLAFVDDEMVFRYVGNSDTLIFANLAFRRLPLHKVLGLAEPTQIGFLDGEISFSGDKHRPRAEGNLRVDEIGSNNGLSYYTDLEFAYDSDRFILKKFRLNTDEVTILDAEGEYSPPLDSLVLLIRGAGFDINSVMQAANGGEGWISGRSLVDIQVSGSPRNPDVQGVIAVKAGKIRRVPFDELEMRLGRNAETSSSVSGDSTGGIYVNRIRLLRKDYYAVTGSAFVPVNLEDSLHIYLTGEGNFLAIVPDLEKYFKNASSEGDFSAEFNGSLSKPRLKQANLSFRNGRMEFDSIIPPVRDVVGEIAFLPDGRFVQIKKLEGKVGGEWFRISTVRAMPGLARRRLEDLDLGGSGINLGVFVLESGKRGIPLNITGLMEKDVYGRLQPSGRAIDESFVLAGPIDRPVLRGTIDLHDFRFMYPFQGVEGEEDNIVVQFLRRIDWDLRVRPRDDVRYINTLPGALDKVYVNMLINDHDGKLDFTGQIQDETFRIEGKARSSTGLLEYFDMTFRVQEVGVEFDHGSIFPIVYGEARTTVTDSLGLPSQVILTLQTVDQTMNKKPVADIVKQEQVRGRWDQIRFKLTTDNPNLGTNEAQILASLGYSTETLQDKAFDAIGISTENVIFRPLYRPVERHLEELFNLDYVRFSSRFTRNLIASNVNDNAELSTRLALLRSTRLVVGKYLGDRLFLQYTGQVESGIDYKYKEKNIGLRHTFGLEYRINPKLLLELEYDYNSMIYENRDDKRIVLRHWFPF